MVDNLVTLPNTYTKMAYNHYSDYLRNRYNGKKVYKVIVDGGFTCPNRDGTKGYGGCTYCNVDSFTPETARNQPDLAEQIHSNVARVRNGYGAEKYIIYFQPNTNTYAPVHYLKSLYDKALENYREDIVGLSIGTRPDCIDAEKLKLLESYIDQGLDVDLELGMESIYDSTLEQINRGYSHKEFHEAMVLTQDSPVKICVHTIFGLPGETKEQMLRYAEVINSYTHIKFIKLHHLHIVEGSIMGAQYKKKPFPLFTLEAYTEFLAEFIPLLRKDIVIQRLFGISDYKHLIAPNWGLKKSEIQSYMDKTLVAKNVVQGSALEINSGQ